MHPFLTVAYGYNPQNNALTGEVNAYLDPLASTDKKPVYTLPANATWTKPPADELPSFCRLEYHGDAWQVSPDREALSKEIDGRIAEADSQINVSDDLVAILNEELQINPDDATSKTDLVDAKKVALNWKRYRLALAKMAAKINDLDVAALDWPAKPEAPNA